MSWWVQPLLGPSWVPVLQRGVFGRNRCPVFSASGLAVSPVVNLNWMSYGKVVLTHVCHSVPRAVAVLYSPFYSLGFCFRAWHLGGAG